MPKIKCSANFAVKEYFTDNIHKNQPFILFSAGMRGHKMQLARETLLYFIKGLPMGCYFNIISFGGEQLPLFK